MENFQKFVYIHDIFPGGPADKENEKTGNRMEIGDRIDKVGDKPVKGILNADLEMMLKTCPAEVRRIPDSIRLILKHAWSTMARLFRSPS